MRVAVLGAGVAGCGAALALAQEGHDVVVVDRSDGPPPGTPDEVFDTWSVDGIAQHRQPHAVIGLGRAVLRDRFPDLYGGLLAAGAHEVDQATFLGDAPRLPGDEDLVVLCCRRPVIDAVLRQALPAFRRAEVSGLVVRDGAVSGLRLHDGEITADLVVDAGGRASRAPAWLETAGHPQPAPQASDCGLLYYSRHYRVRDGEPLPPYASPLGGPRGDLGYLAFAVFLGDNRTFCLCVMVPPSDRSFRDLRHAAAFERVAALLPGMAAWRDTAEPITDVLPMGHLRNTLHQPSTVSGLIALGDARCHTNPTFAYGLSMGLAHGALLAELSTKTADLAELAALFAAEVDPDLQSRYDAVTAEDRDRARIWGGEPVDVTDPAATMPFFLRSVVYRVAPRDPALMRAAARRINALDPVDQLESSPELIARAQALYADLPASPAPPPRSALLDALTA